MPEIAILVTSLRKIEAEGLTFVFTDRHAYVKAAEYFDDLQNLDRIDWPLLDRRDFKRDPDDPAKGERYQAEALIHKVVPVSALHGIACYGAEQEKSLRELVARLALPIKIFARPTWYF